MKRFVRFWFVVSFSYVTTKLLFDLALMGWIDLRRPALIELALLPLGQTLALWAVTRRSRRSEAARTVASVAG